MVGVDESPRHERLGTMQSLYEAQADYRRHGDEIAVIVKKEEVVFQGYLGNETVDCAPNSDSLFAAGKIDAGCPGV